MIKLIISLIMLTSIMGNKVFAQIKKEKEVASAVEALRKAMIDADSTSLDHLTSNDLIYGHSSGKVETKAQFIESLTSGSSDFVTIELSDQTIKISDNTAIVHHILSATNNDNGKPGTVKLGILLVWQKQKDQWKLIARQAVRM